MSLNDRAGEAYEIVLRNGIIDTPEVRWMLAKVLFSAKEGDRFQDGVRSAATSIRDANPEMSEHVWDGEWHDRP